MEKEYSKRPEVILKEFSVLKRVNMLLIGENIDQINIK